VIKNTPTICSFCSCGCGMFVRTQDGEARGVLPSTSHPVSQGRLCHRGWNRFQNLRSVNRLVKPLVREGEGMKETGWNEALKLSGEKIKDLIGKHGPESIGVIGSPWLSNEDNYLVSLLARQVIGTKNLDGSYRFGAAAALSALNQLFGEGIGAAGSIPALKESPAVLVAGQDAHRDFSPVGSRIVQAFKQGAQIILADASASKAEHFYKTLIPVPADRLPSALAAKRDIPAEVLDLLGKPGAGLVFVADQLNPSASVLALINYLIEHRASAKDLPNILALSRCPNLRGAWDLGIRPPAGGLNLEEMLAPESKVKGLLVFAEDLSVHLPKAALLEKLKKLDFVLWAGRFRNDTAKGAHVVLPLPLFAESEGTLTNCEGRIQVSRPALSPRGECRGLSEVLPELAQALGKSLPGGPAAAIRKEIGKAVPGYEKIAGPEVESEAGALLAPPRLASAPPKPAMLPALESPDKFLLLIPNTLYAWERNRMIAESPVLYIEYQTERPALKMNLQDAKDLKFRPGEKAKIRSERGELQVALQADEGVPRRTLVLSSHFLNLVEGVAGKGEIDPVTRSVYFPSLLVTVEKA